jgi:hypothetical protein
MCMDPKYGVPKRPMYQDLLASSPNIQGRVEKTQDRRLSKGGPRGGSGLRTALLPGRGQPRWGLVISFDCWDGIWTDNVVEASGEVGIVHMSPH